VPASYYIQVYKLRISFFFQMRKIWKVKPTNTKKRHPVLAN